MSRLSKILATLLLACGASLAATPPDRLNYQGVLRDAADNPLTGTYAMQFTFFDTVSGGIALLSDLQNAPGVTASGGLFGVELGLNPQGGFPYTSLAAMFAARGTVFMEIKVGAETLTPRIAIRSAPYSLNSDHLDGLSSGAFGLVGAPNAWTGANTFTGGLFANGSIRVDNDGPDGNQSIDFYEGGSPIGRSLAWDDTDNRLEWNDSVAISGALRIGSTAAAPTAYSVIGTGVATATAYVSTVNDLLVSDDAQVAGTLVVGTEIRMNDDGPDGNQIIRFYNAGAAASEAIYWDDSADEFVVSDQLSADVLHSAGSVEADGNVYVNQDGPDGDSRVYFYEAGVRTGESITWFDSSDYFNISDDVNITNDLAVAGTKNFVQNYPGRVDLSVVYTALEGDEAGTYTRGSARLDNGVARLPLGGSFALVTNPDIGLTAQITARGAAATLWVESLTTRELVVRGTPDTARDQRFDFVVMGLRIGYERHPVVQLRRTEAPLPTAEHWNRRLPAERDAPANNSLDRFRTMLTATGAPNSEESEVARALRRGIGEHDPDAPETAPTAAPSAATPAIVEKEPGTIEPTPVAPVVPGERDTFRSPLLAAVDVSEPVASGDLLTLDPSNPGRFRRASEWADPGVVGIVAGDSFVADGHARVYLATTGIYVAHAEALRTAIAAGDLLVASSLAGHVAKAGEAKPGTVVGKALDPLPAGTGSIRILVMLR